VPKVQATRELFAPPRDVWAFLAEPHNLPDWWPGVAGVQPDRRGVAPGARWQVMGDDQPTFLRRPRATGALLVLAAERERRFAFQLTGERLDVELTLEPVGHDRTLARLEVDGPWLIGLRRSLPRQALGRLHALVQTSWPDDQEV
jgi:uncharacterized protein YndB with AHSA1/START domain